MRVYRVCTFYVTAVGISDYIQQTAMADNKVNNDLETYLTTLLTAEVTQLPTDG
jgi:hypothetical protein